MTSLQTFAVVAEPLGVFLLSVEAIKIENIVKLRARVGGFHNRINPTKEFRDTDPNEPTERTTAKDVLAGIATGIIVMFIITPLVLVMWPFMRTLRWLELQVASGVVGALGFIFWVASFLINRALS